MGKIEFRTLEPEDIELRVGMANGNGFSLLLYKNARIDMQILDETFGCMGWQRHHSRDNANCIVSIWDDEKKQWVEKEDTGTESQTEREKGLASDSFKRACVNLGIGRELYTAPFIWIKGHVEQESRARSGYKADNRFVGGLKVSTIEYSEKRTITKLAITDADGEIVYSYGMKKTKASKPKNEAVEEQTPKGSDPITDAQAHDIKVGLEATDADVKKFLGYFHVSDVESMTQDQYQKAIEMLRKKMEKGAKNE